MTHNLIKIHDTKQGLMFLKFVKTDNLTDREWNWNKLHLYSYTYGRGFKINNSVLREVDVKHAFELPSELGWQ